LHRICTKRRGITSADSPLQSLLAENLIQRAVEPVEPDTLVIRPTHIIGSLVFIVLIYFGSWYGLSALELEGFQPPGSMDGSVYDIPPEWLFYVSIPLGILVYWAIGRMALKRKWRL